MLIPELGEIPRRLGRISLALLPTNGLHIRPANNMQVVMNAQEAAELTAILDPELAIPHHYAFTKGFLGRPAGGRRIEAAPLPRMVLDILDAGGLLPRLVADGYLPRRDAA